MNNQKHPNIVLILADDMGFSDIGCYGSEIQTPNLNRLAAEGMRFTQFYNCARCCPTRASLLTGLYPHQAGVGHMVANHHLPGYLGRLRDDCVTIAEALRSAGYRTFMSGKWHVGGAYQYNRPETWRPGDEDHPLPIQRGFDHHYGTLGGAGSYYKPPTLIRDDQLIVPEGEPYYYTDAITQEAVRMIGEGAKSGRRFFLYVAYTAPHWPLHAPPEDIAKYEGKYRRGWDVLRIERHERMKAMGLVDKRWPISPRDREAPPWADVPHKEWEDLRMAVYAAQVHRMDQGVGRIMAALDEMNIVQDTLVMFLSDNGGCAEFLAEDGPERPDRFDIPTRDGRPVHIGNSPRIRPGPEDTFMSYDLPWANASNTPFRRFKRWVHEGGIATPFIAHWPGVIPAGDLNHSVAHVIDIMATCLDAAGISYPEQHDGRSVTFLEGESLMPACRGERWTRERPLFWEHEGHRAVRDGRWKLVSEYRQTWELYDMEEDRTELHDLAAKNPAKVAEMSHAYEAWAWRCNVVARENLLKIVRGG